MTKGLALLLLACCQLAGATTYTVTPAQSTSKIQAVIARASAGDTISFTAGTYKIGDTLTLKCGVTYTGAVATPATAILSSTMGEHGTIFSLSSKSDLTSPCTQTTTIEYLDFLNSGGIYVRTSFTNLNILHNQFGNLPCCNNNFVDQAIFFGGGETTSNTAAMLTNTTISHNTFGDSTSCTAPMNAMTRTISPEDYQGACNGIVFFTSINGLTITYNNFYHLAEGVHINCPNYGNQQYACEPPGGAITVNITARYNDFSNIHRITWEEQPQQSSGIDFEYNSEHDWFMPYFGSFGLSMACCYNGTNPPGLNGSNNVIVFNVNAGVSGRYGYGMEAMGRGATYNNILLQAVKSPYAAGGIAYACGPVASVSNNTVQGGFVSNDSSYIENENASFPCGTSRTPASFTGNVTGPKVSSIPSVAPAFDLPSGPYSFPLKVRLTDPGYTSGPQPLGNTGVWYTTDGSTPVPGAGTAQYVSSGGTFVLPAAATVKAVGMWGAANQPARYPPGFGFVPSEVKTAHYSSGPASQQRPR